MLKSPERGQTNPCHYTHLNRKLESSKLKICYRKERDGRSKFKVLNLKKNNGNNNQRTEI